MAQYVLSELESMYPDQFGVVNPEHIYLNNDPTKTSINNILNNIEQYTDEEVNDAVNNILDNYNLNNPEIDPPNNPNSWDINEEINFIYNNINEIQEIIDQLTNTADKITLRI